MPTPRRVAALLAVLACEPAPPRDVARAPAPVQEPAPGEPASPGAAPAPAPVPPRGANEAVLDHLFGPRPAEPPAVERTGFFTIARVVRFFGKDPSYQPSTLSLDDGTRLVLAHRPLPGYLAFVDRRVVVAGWPAGSQYFRVATMSLAPGEVAREGVIDHLPPPPQVRSGAELRRHLDHWVLAVGTVERVDDAGKGHSELVLRLGDGARVIAGATFDLRPRYRESDRVTVLGHVWRTDGELRMGNLRVCAGEVDRCDGD
ncbi:hypothetical protein [Nannocystis sp. SCPEA4]|uniref:hypothetical protein n=1 Tax=Nannocystis sp. SCPEA4 TaxID=2996787 RepID=UPI0022714B15|nr:hypothetical protein [Nannocystis sp. SCPEA4]MCY1056675.1 hypothetical protein [Nannocystis sp. SCPEA4]